MTELKVLLENWYNNGWQDADHQGFYEKMKTALAECGMHHARDLKKAQGMAAALTIELIEIHELLNLPIDASQEDTLAEIKRLKEITCNLHVHKDSQ